ncbi:ATP dependent DNA ligase [Lentinus brumalis]|uniref:ATP dependent DNA ligase n=1 Tax=Lentinus brumalis TaxID=2498619 RepID=A0A371DDC4_9APHY|nr:ATP dependent DNA ligase [Polyporus brumalis]
MSLAWYRGCLAIVGPRVDQIAQAASSRIQQHTQYAAHTTQLLDPCSSSFHITVITKDELRNASIKEAIPSLKDIDTHFIHFAGVGGSVKHGVSYVVIVWAAGQTLRKRVGLKPKNFHVTLSVRDEHALHKGVDSVLPGLGSPSLTSNDPDFLDHLAFTFHINGMSDRARTTAYDLCKAAPASERGYLRLGDAALKECDYKLASLAYACAYERCADNRVSEYCLKRLEECAGYTEWGCAFTDLERSQLHDEAPRELLQPWSAGLRGELSAREPRSSRSFCLQSRDPVFIPHPIRVAAKPEFYRLPRFFRWLVPFHVALMSTPRDAADIVALASPHLGIRHNTPMSIHCGGGKGRAGTVAACYLVAYGFAKPDSRRTEPAMSAKEAIAALRAMRPGSIETEQQEEFVAKYCSAIWKRQAALPDLVPEPPPCPLEIEGSLPQDADLFVLVGLAGSGKTTFSRMLMARDPRGWTYISQDDSGSRKACETAIGNVRPGRGRVLLDRCNVSRDDRKEWLKLASHWATSPVCVWFDYDRELCVSRAQNRAGHPTLPPGNRVRNTMDQMQNMFVRPSLKEGFEAIVTVRSFAAAEEFVSRLSPPVGLFKFPRTAHLLNLGSATDDDVISTTPSVTVGDGCHVVITEKVDGANMGFSLSADRTQILVQNRSHYVNPASHEQFRRLGSWIERHRADLMRVLDRDPLFAQRYVLFGEWLVATHSIAYSLLPDWFLAFDLYDRSLERWADRRTLEALLEGTDIRLVPVLHEGRMWTEEELRQAVLQPSKFYEGPVEGVYVKVEKQGRVVSRGKVARADFISGNEHWSKGPLQLNVLQHTEAQDTY